MKLAVMQPYTFPYLGYYQLIAAVERFVVYDDVNYIKQGWINRNNILVNNAPHLFSIPLQSASSNRAIAEIAIVQNSRWQDKLIRTLNQAYRDAPYFAAAMPMVEEVLRSSTLISEMATRSLTVCCDYLQIDTQFVLASQRYRNQSLSGQARVIDICQREGASIYVNAIGGRGLYSAEDFARNSITLRFLQPNIQPYPQLAGSFIGHLSIIDVLMFNSRERAREMVFDHEIVQ